MIKTVIIGFAHMHVNEVALYISGQPDTTLAAIADLSPLVPENTDKRYTRAWNLQNVKDMSNADVYSDYVRMLDEVKPDWAYILCENYAKPAVALECAKRGVNIVIEKPMACTLRDAEAIACLPEKYGIEIAVNWPVAWRPFLHQLKKTADSGICGEPLRLRYLNGHTGPLGKGARHRGVSADAEAMSDEERSRIWWYMSECGGGAFLDILCYGCYFTRWLLGSVPDAVSTVGANLGTPYADCEDNVAAIFRFADKRMATAEGSWTIPRAVVPAGPQLICSDGAIMCEGGADEGQFVSAYGCSGEKRSLSECDFPESMKNMPWQIAAHVISGQPLFETLTLDFNMDVMRMLDAAIRSNELRTEVEI